MKRRSFLRHVSHSVAVPGVLGSMGFRMTGSDSMASLLRMAAETDRVLVMIFLEGGNDGLNTVIPLDQLSPLNSVRPHVILPENSLHELPDTGVALHPALSGLKSLYEESRLKIVQNVGYPEQNYSHFRSTDIWMSASDSKTLVNSGWTGRYLSHEFPDYPDAFPNEEMPDPLSIEIGYGSSLLFQGPQNAMGMVINDPEYFYELVENTDREVPNTPAGEKLKYVRLIARQSQQYGEVVQAAAGKVKSQSSYPNTFLGQQLKIVSRLIAGGLRTPLYLVRLGGFDTHDAQVEASDHTKGEHAQLLKELNDGIMAFMSDLERQGTEDRVVGMTFSEFGRRIISNASLGTDHGAAAPMFFFGNAVKKGVLGANPRISYAASYDDNLDWEFDFRQLYASILEQWLDASPLALESSMLGGFETLPIIGSAPLSAEEYRSKADGLIVFPNPLEGQAVVRVKSIHEEVRIQIIDLSGRPVDEIFSGSVNGAADIPWDTTRLPAGRYVVLVRGAKTYRTCSVIKAR